MKIVFLLFSSSLILADNVPARNATNKRIVDIGVVGVVYSAIDEFTRCICPYFYAQTPMMALLTPVMDCLQSSIGLATIGGWGISILPPMELCLQSKGSSSTTKVASAAAAVLAPEIMIFYNNMMKNFTDSKAKGQTKDKVLNNGFAMINKRYTRPYIDELCRKIVKNMSVVCIKCCFDNAKKIVDFTTYACYLGASKSNLLG